MAQDGGRINAEIFPASVQALVNAPVHNNGLNVS